MEAETAFPPELASAAATRRFAEQVLGDWGCDALVESARLLVSELVVNAVLHARTDGWLRLELHDGRLRVEVHDASTANLQPRSYAPDATTGRGLMILDALADRWGVELDDAGKTVWFELDPPLPATAGERPGVAP
jgi:anti-sigma regulatory factor (Ser/Thr protein kinase)